MKVKQASKSKKKETKLNTNPAPKTKAKPVKITKREIKSKNKGKPKANAVKETKKVVTTTTTVTSTNGKKTKKTTKKVIQSVSVTPTQNAPVVTPLIADQKIVTGIVTNNALVDPKHPGHQDHTVVPDKNGDFNGKSFDSTMNQSDLKNNNNKFYIIQMLKNNTTNTLSVWNRWGRVGYDGQSASFNFPNLDSAKASFLKKYNEKVKKGYTPLVMDYSSNDTKIDTSVKTTAKVKKVIKESKLPRQIQDLMNLIYDTQIMNKQMSEIGYDAKKMPLGKLGKETILAGYNVLNKIEKVLKSSKKVNDLLDLSSQFYSLIPHDFGFKQMSNFALNTLDKIKEKVNMLDSLSQIEIATKILNDTKDSDDDLIEHHYRKLDCEIRPIENNAAEFKVLEKFLQNSKLNHNANIVEAFRVNRNGEDKKFKDLGNKLLLWHGSRITNFVGILSQGLRIAPPEAPVSGYRFGKGCYFADMACKSIGYCCPSNQTALILLCEVSIGNPNVVKVSDSSYCLSKLPKGTHSTKYLGGCYPPSDSYIDLDGVQVPIGTPDKQQSWDFNEYIVYDTSQLKLKYLLRLKV